jgi:hypothetical protein
LNGSSCRGHSRSTRGARDRRGALAAVLDDLRPSLPKYHVFIGDLVFTTAGVEAILRRSKTDQEGVGRRIGIPYGSLLATSQRQ